MITMIPTCMLRRQDFASGPSSQMQQTRQQLFLKSHSINQMRKLDKKSTEIFLELNQAMIVITNCRSSSPNCDDLTNRMRRRHRVYGGRRSMQLTWACGTQRRVATMRWAPSGRALRTASGRRSASYHGGSGTARRVNIQLISGLRAVIPQSRAVKIISGSLILVFGQSNLFILAARIFDCNKIKILACNETPPSFDENQNA